MGKCRGRVRRKVKVTESVVNGINTRRELERNNHVKPGGRDTHRQAWSENPSPMLPATATQLCVAWASTIHKSSLRSVASVQGPMMKWIEGRFGVIRLYVMKVCVEFGRVLDKMRILG